MRYLPEAKLVSGEDVRPAGRKGECFYCNEKVGTYHKRFCVIVACFPVTVVITDTKTGKQRTYHTEEYEQEDGWHSYMWTDGNYSCDCNRRLFWLRAARSKPNMAAFLTGKCGEGRYRIDSITRDADGELLYSEGAST